MLTIEKKALEFAKNKQGNFIVKTISASGGCCDVNVKSLWIEVLKNFDENKNYICYEYDGIKVFIEKTLELDEDILIYQKIKLPIFGSIFGSKGINIKYI